MLQMTVTKQNAPGIEEFVETVKDWPISGVAFTMYVPRKNERTAVWPGTTCANATKSFAG